MGRRSSWSGDRVAFPDKMRRRILRRDRVCVHCRSRPATQADHIVPVAEGGRHTIDNGQGLCDECHEVKTRAEIERGKARAGSWPKRKRPPEQHPGLIDQPGVG